METKTVQKPEKHICSVCSKSFEWKSGLSRHKKLLHSEINKTYKCSICGQTFSKQTDLSVHLKSHETGENKTRNKISKIYANVVTETVYSSDSDCEYEILQTIVKVQPEKGERKCEKCGRTFIKELSLNRHLNKHNENDSGVSSTVNNSCNKCGKVFKNTCNLTNHLKLHLKESVAVKKLELNKKQNNYPCNLCNRIYLKQSHLQNHLILHKSNNESVKQSIHDKLYLCMVCGKRYTRSSHLSLHMRTHMDLRPHLCSVCGKYYIDYKIVCFNVVCFCRKIVYFEEVFDNASESTC